MQRGITFGQPNSCRRRSATNSMYWRMRTQFIPIMLTGSASVRNSCSILTAFEIISVIRSLVGRVFKCLNMMHAKSQWSPSSLEINSLEKVRPGISPRFFIQKIAANEPEKKIPSTAAKATILSAYGAPLPIHFIAHSAFLPTQGRVSIALKRWDLWAESRMYVSIRRLYISEWMFSIAIWNP